MSSRPLSQKAAWIGAGLLALILVVGMVRSCGRDDENGAALTAPVRRGRLTIAVTEKGSLTAQEQVVIKSRVPGRATILFLVPEGELVKEGDLLVELDSSALVEEKIEREIKVQNAEAAFVRAREELEITRNQGQSDVEKADLDHQFAVQDLEKYMEGEYPQEKKEAESRISLAEEDVQRAAERLKWSLVLFEDQHISQTELLADELSHKKAELELELAKGKLELLINYKHQRQLAELESSVKQNRMALDRVKRRAQANIVQREAELRARELDFNRQKDKLHTISEYIDGTRITAPADGQVIYSTSVGGNRHWRQNQEPLAEGQEVVERQDLIYLPATTMMMATIKIHESNVEKIKLDMPVTVTVDALPGRTFVGRVAKVSPLPDATSWWQNPDVKVYDTEVHIEGDGSELRSGMTCLVEIMVEEHNNVLYVPVQSVIKVKNVPTAYVVNRRGKALPRPLEIGMDNNRMVHVISGVEEGDRVLLTPPLEKGERIDAGISADEAGKESGGKGRPARKGPPE